MSGKRYKAPQVIPAPPHQQRSTAIVQTQTEFFTGPIPPPSILAKYNEVIPDGANRILAMAERQSAHREAQEAKIIEANLASQTRGSYFAFILCLMTILGGIALSSIGKSLFGLVSIISGLATLASVFFYSKHEQKRERLEKTEALASRRQK